MWQLGLEPDGTYVPRIMFAEPNRRARPDLMHPRKPPFQKYHYGSAEEVRSLALAGALLAMLSKKSDQCLLQVLQGMRLTLHKMGL